LEKTERRLLICYFTVFYQKPLGGFISKTVYDVKSKERFIALKCDLYLLRKLGEAKTLYDIVKELDYPRSSAYNVIHEYLLLGIIDEIRSEKLKSGLTKRYYKLSELGYELLEILEKITKNRVSYAVDKELI
jgi:hypothetical protein